MDFGIYCYVIAIKAISGSVFSEVSRAEVLTDMNYILSRVSSSSFLPV